MNKKEAKQWLKDHPHPSQDEVIAVLQSLVKDLNGHRFIVRDAMILVDYCNSVSTRVIADKHSMTPARVRQIVESRIRIIVPYIVKHEYDSKWLDFYKANPHAKPSFSLEWVRRAPDVILSKIKYLILKHADWA